MELKCLLYGPGKQQFHRFQCEGKATQTQGTEMGIVVRDLLLLSLSYSFQWPVKGLLLSSRAPPSGSGSGFGCLSRLKEKNKIKHINGNCISFGFDQSWGEQFSVHCSSSNCIAGYRKNESSHKFSCGTRECCWEIIIKPIIPTFQVLIAHPGARG